MATSASRPSRLDVLEHPVDAAVDLVGIRARRPEDRPAARQDPGDLAPAERLDDPLHEAAPALPHADDLPAAIERAPRDGPDDRVQSGAIAPAREDADPVRHARSLPRRAAGRRV